MSGGADVLWTPDLDGRYSLEEKSDCFPFIDDVQSKLLSQD